jgi:ABC-type Fe3+ transport system permease subunit
VISAIALLIVLAIAIQSAKSQRRLKEVASFAETQRRLATLIDSLPGIVFSCSNDPNFSMTYFSEGCLN